MCTVSYVPSAEGIVITANRDENASRNAEGISTHVTRSGALYHVPKEPVHGGSNLAIAEVEHTYVLLNGAFEPHPFGGEYRMSRGLVLLEALEHQSLEAFREGFNFMGIEPFTLLHFAEAVEELRWDGALSYHQRYAAHEPRIWASAQLYSAEVINARQAWFASVLSAHSGDVHPADLWHFHRYGGTGDPENDMVMQRNGLVQTVSISQVLRANQGFIRHLDLLRNEELRIGL